MGAQNRRRWREKVSFDRDCLRRNVARMAALDLSKLLALQESDSQRLALEQQLQAAPREIAAVEAKIAAEKGAIEAAKAEWHGLESKKKLLEVEIKSAEDKAAKYRTQQLEVRKNDEYKALTHE